MFWDYLGELCNRIIYRVLLFTKKLAEYLGVPTIHPSSSITHSDHCLAKRFRGMFYRMFLGDV